MKRILFSVLILALAACGREPYVIVQIADAQFGFTSTVECRNAGVEYDNDVTVEAEYLAKAVALVNEMRPDAVIFTGDQVNHCSNEIEWDAFNKEVAAIDKDITVYHIPGNHDVILSENKVDMSTYSPQYGEGHFVVSENGVRVVGVNSNYIKYNDPKEEEQMAWLQEALKKGRKDEVTLVFSHHPFFLKEVGEDDGYFQIQRDKRQKYMEMFESYGVDALYAGHLHNNSAGEYNGIPVTTTTSVCYQIGDAQPSVLVITVDDGVVTDELVTIK